MSLPRGSRNGVDVGRCEEFLTSGGFSGVRGSVPVYARRRSGGASDTLLKGLAHPLPIKSGKVALVETGDEGCKIVQDHLDTSFRCEAGEQESENGGNCNIGNGAGMQPDEENVAVPKVTNLSGVLESLMSLDSRGDFMGSLDGFSAPNHSRGIESSMCFAMMQEKIRTQQYLTWRVFVGDFERICFNALRCNQKRSIIWAAADDLLRRGKKRLEEYEGRGETLVALNRTSVSHASVNSKFSVTANSDSESLEARLYQDDESLVPEEVKMAISSAAIDSAENMPPSSESASLCNGASVGKDNNLPQQSKVEKREKEMSGKVTPLPHLVPDVDSVEMSPHKEALKPDVGNEVRIVDSVRMFSEGLPVTIPSVTVPLALGQTDEDVDLEGEMDVKAEDQRFTAEGDATESSSSYDSAGSAREGEVDSDKMPSMFEAESVLRDGNGAVGLLDDDDGLPTSERRKKALDADWRLSRRGIEWRGHWLELRTQAIQSKLVQYDNLLKSAQSEKIWRWEGEVAEGTSARTVPVKILRNHHVIHRKHRKRAEDALDLDLGRHPVFSRYEKRKTQRKSDDDFGLTQGKVDSQQVQQTEFEIEPETTAEKEYLEQQQAADVDFVGHDSMEKILWQVEALQVRVKKQKHILRKEAAVRKNSTATSKAGVSNTSPRVLPSTQRGSSSGQALPSPRALPRGGLPSSSSGGLGRSSSGSGLPRRRASDYDISNMVMPVHVGSTFVEQVRHVDIETPLWRIVEDANPAVQLSEESCSEEETDDEYYINRHSIMEALERQQRYTLPHKRSASDIRTVGKGKLKVGIGKCAVQMTGKALPSAPTPIITRSADNVPKRQRSKWNTARRVPASSLDSSVLPTTSGEVRVMKPEVKSEIAVDDSDASPLGVEIGGEAVITAEKDPPMD